ncbi:MAG TPA: LytR C-terminal domain-containing protein [Solirubrobacteraceae bacterium]|nr:LytR C-terminal domain-containing protein [Solirubrobacteraceae bacterium]
MASILAVIVALVVLATQVLGGGSSSSRSASSPVAPAPSVGPAPGAGGHSGTHVRVAVLNGTTVAGLARKVADRLVGGGYRIGTVTNAASHQHATTVVYYMPGRQSQAAAVAQSIGASPTAVQPIDPPTQAVSHGAPVVVTVGADSRH